MSILHSSADQDTDTAPLAKKVNKRPSIQRFNQGIKKRLRMLKSSSNSSIPTTSSSTSPVKKSTSNQNKANLSINSSRVTDTSLTSNESIHSANSSASESRKRQSKRDDAIRRRIEHDLKKKKKGGSGSSRKRRSFKAGTVMSLRPNDPIACKASSTVYEISQLMTAKRENCILVINEAGELMGIFTAKDLAFRVVGAGLNASSITIDQIMTPNPICAFANQPASEALTLMVEKGFRHLPVLDEETNQILGVLDITKCYEQQMEKLERMHSSSSKLDDALNSIHSEIGIDEHPAQVFEYFETLKQKMNSPTLESVLDFTTGPVFTNVKASVYEATILMKENRTTAVLIKDTNDEVAGIFTSKDVVLRVIAAGLDPKTCSIVRVMTPHPDVANVNLPVQQALRQMLEGHYLNLPVIGEDQEIIGIVDVLRLTYVTLSQIKSVETKDLPMTPFQSKESGNANVSQGSGPAWNKFWTTFDHQLLDDNGSVHSDTISGSLGAGGGKERGHHTLPPPDVTASEIHSFEIEPSDSVSHVDSKSETRDLGVAVTGTTTTTLAEEDTPFTFKFKSPGIEGRVNRITVHPSDGVDKLRGLIEQKLIEKDFTALKIERPVESSSAKSVTSSNTCQLDDTVYAVSYVDDEGDVVSITSNDDLAECIRINQKLQNDKADLYIHNLNDPVVIEKVKPVEPIKKPAKTTIIPGVSNEMLISGVLTVVASSAIIGFVLRRK